MYLNKNDFSQVVKNTPLVSIDLLISSADDKFLIGKRLNRPAKGYWFVPGGRILKDESFANAFKRITKEELGESITICQAKFNGIFEHFYKDSVYGTDYSTHYVVHAYEIKVNPVSAHLPFGLQHESYNWVEVEDLLADDSVHRYTKNYFS